LKPPFDKDVTTYKDANMLFFFSDLPTVTKEGNVLSQVLVADQSGSIYLSLFDDMGSLVKPGDILSLDGYTSLYRGSLSLYVGRNGLLKKMGEITMIFSEEPNMSTCKWLPDPKNPKMLVPHFDKLSKTTKDDQQSISEATPLPVSIASAIATQKRVHSSNIDEPEESREKSSKMRRGISSSSDASAHSTSSSPTIPSRDLFNEQFMAALITASRLDPSVIHHIEPEKLTALLQRPEIQAALSQLGYPGYKDIYSTETLPSRITPPPLISETTTSHPHYGADVVLSSSSQSQYSSQDPSLAPSIFPIYLGSQEPPDSRRDMYQQRY
jgi:hypothetical protein